MVIYSTQFDSASMNSPAPQPAVRPSTPGRGTCVKILMLRQPCGVLHGVALKWYRPGVVYDLPAALAAYLVTEGFGMVEMRSEQRRPSPVEPDRRRKPAAAGI
jgi:hypothetical protein